MADIHVEYHAESDGWWAESAQLPGWTALGDTFHEVRAMARSGAAEFAPPGAVVVEHGVPMDFTLNQSSHQFSVNFAFGSRAHNTSTNSAPAFRIARPGSIESYVLTGDLEEKERKVGSR